jgi:leader peptidase (prepilin peptidase)/N-methyltransferase
LPNDAIIGAVIGYLLFATLQTVFHLITGKTGMGQGDYKYLAALGAFLGWQQLSLIILLASVIGLIFGLVHIGIRHQFKSVPIPFGPYLAIAGWICLIRGNEMLHVLSQYYL